MLKIWGRENSTNVKKALWCADELGLAYEHVNAGGPYGVVNTPEYRALNPNGLVPCIQDDGFTLWESNSIVRYFCATHAAGTLFYPDDPKQRAHAEKWMDWCISTFTPSFRVAFMNLVRTAPEKRDMAAVEKGLQACERNLAILDAALADSPYLSGESFGMGDIPMGSLVYSWLKMPIEHPEFKHLEAWYERLTQRPQYQKRVMLPLT